MNTFAKTSIVLGLSVLGVACTTAEPMVNTEPGAYVSPDGLYMVENARMDIVMVKPDLDLTQYDSISLAPVSIAYKRGSYELTNEQHEQMLATFNEVLAEELDEGDYDMTTQTGPNVLQANVKIIDLYVNRPTDMRTRSSRDRIFTATSGEISLIGELRDSESGELLVQFADRNQPRRYWAESTSVSEWSEVRSAFRFWADILKTRLDYFHDNPDMDNQSLPRGFLTGMTFLAWFGSRIFSDST